MSMPKGLAKATNYYNRLEAIRDWNKLANQVSNAGMSDLAAKYRPNDGDGWRKIDKKIAALREAFQQCVQLTAGTRLATRTHRYWDCPKHIDGENNLSTDWASVDCPHCLVVGGQVSPFDTSGS